MVMAKKNGKMVLYIKDTINKVKNKEREFLFGETIAHMKENFMIIIFTEMESMFGRMEGCTKGAGSITRCMEREYLNGLMGGNMKENILMTRNKGLEFLNLRMGECTKESGLRESSTEGENLGRKIM